MGNALGWSTEHGSQSRLRLGGALSIVGGLILAIVIVDLAWMPKEFSRLEIRLILKRLNSKLAEVPVGAVAGEWRAGAEVRW